MSPIMQQTLGNTAKPRMSNTDGWKCLNTTYATLELYRSDSATFCDVFSIYKPNKGLTYASIIILVLQNNKKPSLGDTDQL